MKKSMLLGAMLASGIALFGCNNEGKEEVKEETPTAETTESEEIQEVEADEPVKCYSMDDVHKAKTEYIILVGEDGTETLMKRELTILLEKQENGTITEEESVKLETLMTEFMGQQFQQALEESVEEEQPTEHLSSHEVYSVGDSITVDSMWNGKYEVTITDAYLTDERNEFWDEDGGEPLQVLVIESEYTLLEGETQLSIDSMSIKAYGSDGYALNTYPVYPVESQYISQGRHGVGSMSFAIMNEQEYVELELEDGQIVKIELN